MIAVFKREVQSYFKSPVAFCIIGFFGVLTGLFFWNINLSNQSVEFSRTLSNLIIFLIFFMPVITMRLFSDDKKNGTEVLFRTMPVSTWKIVLGKYFASVAVFLCLCVESMICPVIISRNMTGESVFPLRMTVSAYIAFFLLGLAFLSVGTFASSVTDSQPIAAILGVIILILFDFIEQIGNIVKGTFGKVLVWMSLSSRYNDFVLGMFNVSSLIFYLSFTALMLFITIINIERKRWS